MSILTASLQVDGDLTFKDLRFTSNVFGSEAVQLKLLSIVETARIPFSFVVGTACDVWTDDDETCTWFAEQIMLDAKTVRTQSQNGVLVEVMRGDGLHPQVTEILFYASAQTDDAGSEPAFRLKALPLCSEYLPYLPSPPLSPAQSTTELDGQFLRPLAELRSAALSKEKKRKQVSGLFDSATEQGRKARRRGGESVAAAASKVNNVNFLVGQKKSKDPAKTQQPTRIPLNHDAPPTSLPRPRSRGGSFSAAQEQPRRLTRSPSMSLEIRPVSRRSTVDVLGKRSGLSRMASFSEATTTEERNKEAISRLVMAGMRLYGLQQKKRNGHVRRLSELNAGVPEESSTGGQEDAAKDEEYKLIYHQTYKGVVFALRRIIVAEPLYSHPARLQDTVDKFLAIFCNDPLAPI